ncbi:MAG: SulP family inorganic anion transporter [Campylobacteraceae bacterium]|nr:SulP family inorganic anion transporter [Campylobacteraceae bacterium]
MLNIKDTFIGKSAKSDILSGIVVAIALVPEAIAFSIIAGVSPLVGLYTAFILGLITALIGGKAGMISGATGAIAVVLIGLTIKVKDALPKEVYDSLVTNGELSTYILQYILLATLLAGAFQIIIGVLKLGKFIRLVPQPAMYGFVNGLAIVIAMAQIPLFEGENWIMYALVIATMLIVKYFPKVSNAIPSGLLAIVVISLLVITMDLDTKRVGDLANISGSLPTFALPTLHINFDSLITVLPYSILVALVGLIESLLTLSVLDEMGGKRGSGNQECIAQGIGNITCGFFGGMAGCAMIGQSIINFSNNGWGRLSAVTASLLLISFVVILPDYIALIPVAVLVGIMFMVSIGTFEWESANRFRYMPNSDRFVLVAVTVITIFADLAIAVISGIIISALVFAWNHSKVISKTYEDKEGTKIYEFDGPLFFGSTTSFFELFDLKNDPKEVILDFKDARVMDISGVEAIDSITSKYAQAGKKLTIRHLSEDCKKILKAAGPFCVYEENDPKYKVAVDY